MTEDMGGAQAAGNGLGTDSTVLEAYDTRRPRSYWRPESRNVRALDRHIAHVYGPEYVRGRAA